VKPVRLPKGTVVKVDAVYDNSSDNPKNPSEPPRRVYWGEQTTDEMCLCGMTVITDTPADLKKVRAMNFAELGAILGGGQLPELRNRRAASTPTIDAETRKKILAKLPADGFAIPEAIAPLLAQFDTNHDGRLTAAEIEAMPEPSRSRMVDAIQKKIEAKEKAKEKR
jgi:hypothetical protein